MCSQGSGAGGCSFCQWRVFAAVLTRLNVPCGTKLTGGFAPLCPFLLDSAGHGWRQKKLFAVSPDSADAYPLVEPSEHRELHSPFTLTCDSSPREPIKGTSREKWGYFKSAFSVGCAISGSSASVGRQFVPNDHRLFVLVSHHHRPAGASLWLKCLPFCANPDALLFTFLSLSPVTELEPVNTSNILLPKKYASQIAIYFQLFLTVFSPVFARRFRASRFSLEK